jgi:hypothetical protein
MPIENILQQNMTKVCSAAHFLEQDPDDPPALGTRS